MKDLNISEAYANVGNLEDVFNEFTDVLNDENNTINENAQNISSYYGIEINIKESDDIYTKKEKIINTLSVILKIDDIIEYDKNIDKDHFFILSDQKNKYIKEKIGKLESNSLLVGIYK